MQRAKDGAAVANAGRMIGIGVIERFLLRRLQRRQGLAEIPGTAIAEQDDRDIEEEGDHHCRLACRGQPDCARHHFRADQHEQDQRGQGGAGGDQMAVCHPIRIVTAMSHAFYHRSPNRRFITEGGKGDVNDTIISCFWKYLVPFPSSSGKAAKRTG